MLILNRKLNGKIFIGDNIEIVVVAIRGKTVRLGITAPREMPVVRDDAKNTEPRDYQDE